MNVTCYLKKTLKHINIILNKKSSEAITLTTPAERKEEKKMKKLTRYEIENTVSGIMSDYEYGDCYPDEIMELENRAEIEGMTEEEIEKELNELINDLGLE